VCDALVLVLWWTRQWACPNTAAADRRSTNALRLAFV
jgi:hypothetical protein